MKVWLGENIESKTRILLFAFVVSLFPFISTTTGVNLKLLGLELWKYLWLIWLFALFIYISLGKTFFSKLGGRVEIIVWAVITFMLVFSPKADWAIDPWKSWFFSIFTIFLLRLLISSNVNETRIIINVTFASWCVYAFILFIHVLTYTAKISQYPGSVQHQFFLSGFLGLIAAMLLIVNHQNLPKNTINCTRLYKFLLITVLINLGLNIAITKARSVFPFSLSLMLISITLLMRHSASVSKSWRYLGLPLALLFILLPILHLNGSMGNLVNVWTYPIFGKLRTIESKSGREKIFEIWLEFASKNACVFGPARVPLPSIIQLSPSDELCEPLFGMTLEEYSEVKRQGIEAQGTFIAREKALKTQLKTALSAAPNVESMHNAETVHINTADNKEDTKAETAHINAVDNKVGTTGNSLAITSHNLWLDTVVRSGIIYTLIVAMSLFYIVWAISVRISVQIPAPLAFSYWLMTVSWGIASHFDDEHWIYHIPYLTMFFIPIIAVSVLRQYRHLNSLN